MKLIIDISKNNYNQIREGFYEDNCGIMAISIIDGTLIPDNATNGEVLNALFPNERIGHCEDCTDLGDIATFDDDWWNAPYQKGGKE